MIDPMPRDTPPAEIIWKGRFLQIAKRGRWEFVQRVGSSGVVGIIAVTADQRLLLVEQERLPVGTRVIELPAGLAGDIAGETDETLERAARRELLEETGYAGGLWTPWWDGPSSAGLTDETLQLFLARDVQKTTAGGGDGSESIIVHEIPLAELPQFLQRRRADGTLVDLKVYLATCLLNPAARPSPVTD
jgi:ADP-ribose pyrophosphatase